MINRKKILAILILTVLLFWWNPFQLAFNQNMLLVSMTGIVVVWASNAMNRNLSSLILILLFWIFGETPLLNIIGFAWSNTSLLIMTTMLLSIGISNTGIIDQLVTKATRKFNGNLWFLLIFPYLIGIILVFFIPQAFARVILLGTIFNSLLKSGSAYQKAKPILLFNTFLAVVVTSMFFSNGDVVLNQTTLSFAGPEIMTSLDFSGWFKMMALPSFFVVILMIFSIRLLFRKELSSYSAEMIDDTQTLKSTMPKRKQHLTLLTMLIVVAGWMTEGLHGVPSWFIAFLAAAVMLLIGSVKLKDIKSINLSFILFLTAAFSIGTVMGDSGVSLEIFSFLGQIIPSVDSLFFIFSIILISILLHMFIGSSVATMSVVLPLILPVAAAGGYPGEVITLTVYNVVLLQFIFPVHHQTLMIGSGSGYYSDQLIFRFGLYMTLMIFPIIYLIYLPWWNIIGIL